MITREPRACVTSAVGFRRPVLYYSFSHFKKRTIPFLCGTILLFDGTILFSDGTILFFDGTILFFDGTIIFHQNLKRTVP